MFAQETLDFIADLKRNNNKDWFEANRKRYDAARKNQLEVVSQLLQSMGKWEDAFNSLEPKSCIFRINRDIRFSQDKSPYKSSLSIILAPNGKNGKKGGYYFHVEPGAAFLAGGMWAPEAPVLKAIRQEIDYNLSEFEGIINAPSFKKYFNGLDNEDKLQRPPKDYTPDNPAIEWLKHKHFIASHKLSDKQLISKDLVKTVTEVYKAMQPLNAFLDRVLD
jgi:uncharacterized protein (TIGR02453 family)